MKRIALASLLLAAFCQAALAANATNTPIVPPTETGENSSMQQQVVDMARIKLGFGTTTIAVSGSAGSGTLNFAAGIVTLTAATTGASGATPSVITLNNSKVQVGDFVQCTADQTGATAGSVLVCNAHIASAGVITLSLYSATPTALTSSTIALNFEILTQGNPN
jgi:hypothetical protein